MLNPAVRPLTRRNSNKSHFEVVESAFYFMLNFYIFLWMLYGHPEWQPCPYTMESAKLWLTITTKWEQSQQFMEVFTLTSQSLLSQHTRSCITFIVISLLTGMPGISPSLYIIWECTFAHRIAGCTICISIWSTIVVLMWCPPVTLLFYCTSKTSHHQLQCSENQEYRGKAINREQWEGVRLQGLCAGPASDAFMQWAAWSGSHRQRTAGCPQGHEWQWPFEVVRVAARWLCNPLRTPPFFHTSHMDTSDKPPFWTAVAHRPGCCNLRAAVAACQTTAGDFPLVQAGSKHDPSKPLGQICP